MARGQADHDRLPAQGAIKHKDNLWPGQHEPIIDQKIWDRVRSTMDKQQRATRHTWTHPFLLKGKLRTHDNFAMSPGSVQRPTKTGNRKRLVRYYVSQKAIKHGYKSCEIKTINAKHLDELVRAIVLNHLEQQGIDRVANQTNETRDHWIRRVIRTVTVGTGSLSIELSREAIDECREHEWETTPSCEAGFRCQYTPEIDERGKDVVLRFGIQIKKIEIGRASCRERV